MNTSYQSDEGDDETILSSLEWTHEELVALTRSVLIGGQVVLPIGVNKHFNMIAIRKRFYVATKKRVETRVLWDKLNEMFDLVKSDSLIECPFPNDEVEFSLPEKDFHQLISDRKLTQTSEGRGDTLSGKPIAKKGNDVGSSLATSSSSKKRDHSPDITLGSGTGKNPKF